MNTADAYERLRILTRADDDPTLDNAELEMLLELAATTDADDLAPDDDDWTPTYDRVGVYRAVAEGWTLKAGKAAGRFDFTTDGQTFRRSQIVDHCEAMAARYRRKTNQSAPIGYI